MSPGRVISGPAPAWSSAGSLGIGRSHHPLSALPLGKALVTGGLGRSGNRMFYLNSVELYDPATRTWCFVGNLQTTRYMHTATSLASGKVLIAGGIVSATTLSAELYDPATRTSSSPKQVRRRRALPQAEEARAGSEATASKERMKQRTPRVDWAGLLKRTFDFDVFACVRCGGSRRVLAYVKAGRGVRAIQEHLGLPTAGVSLVPAQELAQASGC